ncbi:MAG: extracellular solute-binding protein [Patescibacteria group bacterium]|nr:extracellular solute-binding protein [Patescibacteria group bacterium]MDD4610603.1 extracellular solute-binding protein [Patescibacteria group bacterium]
MKNKLIIISLLFVFLMTTGLGCSAPSAEVQKAIEPIKLTYWRVWDDSDAFDEIIANYKLLHPFVTIEYKKFRYGEYEQALLEAMAEDRGPDIFSIHNTWTEKYQNKIAPLPIETTMAYPVTQGTIKKEVVNELRTTKSLTINDIKNNFIDTVYNDVVLKDVDVATKQETEKVYALPLAMDTLALYYNKDLFNNAGIATPPNYWNPEFQQIVKKLTKQDSKGGIIQSGVAMGGGKNIERYSDILSILMMQNGAEMMSENGAVSFSETPVALRSQGYNPALEALRFYTDFANPAKEVYSWNANLENSLQMFMYGKLAMMFGYAYHLPTIRAQAPKLNFGIAKLPQIEGSQSQINFANYWVETVSKKSKNIDTAWDFVQFATRAEQAKTYIAKTGKPTALRSLVNEELESPDLGIFASQVLTAKSWYKGADSNAAELIFADMINEANQSAPDKLMSVLNTAAARVQQTVE